MRAYLEVLEQVAITILTPLCPLYWIKKVKRRLRRRKAFEQPPQKMVRQMYQTSRLRSVTLSPYIRDPSKSPPPEKIKFVDDLPCKMAPRLIHQVLPLELLSVISEHLSTKEEIHKFRLVHRRFYEAAWAVFGRTFDERIFHPTVYSAGEALYMLANTKQITPYISILNVSTIYPDVQAGVRLTNWCLDRYLPGEKRYTVDMVEPWLNMLLYEKLWIEVYKMNAWVTAMENLTALEEIVIWNGTTL